MGFMPSPFSEDKDGFWLYYLNNLRWNQPAYANSRIIRLVFSSYCGFAINSLHGSNETMPDIVKRYVKKELSSRGNEEPSGG
jgi:hypothetical protein